jgi:hypothetical protein
MQAKLRYNVLAMSRPERLGGSVGSATHTFSLLPAQSQTSRSFCLVSCVFCNLGIHGHTPYVSAG